MGPDVISGLPAHVLLVHIVVIFVPLAALLVILSAVWPAARRRLGIITPVVALIAVASIPPTTHAGSWLIKRVPRTPLVREHAELADGLLPWAIGMLVFAVIIWALWAKQHWFLRGGTKQDDPKQEQVLVGSAVGGRTAESPAPEPTGAAPARTAPAWLRVVRIVAVVLALAVSVGSVVEVYRIGDAGARAAWQTSFSMAPHTGK